MDTSPTTCRTLEQYYHVNSNTLDKQYKDVLSDYHTWSEIEHADEWLVFPDNVGRNLAIDETSMSNGELRTIVTNRDRHGKDQCLVAIVKGVKSEDVINALKHIPESLLNMVEEVTLDLSDSMRKIVRTCFPKAIRVIDRFHIQKLACDAVQEMRIKHRWDAIQEANDDMENAKLERREYVPFRYENGDTRKELLARSRYLLFKSGEKWILSQSKRAEILFREYPDLKTAYGLSHSLRMIFSEILLRMPQDFLWLNGTTKWKKQASILSMLLLQHSMNITMIFLTFIQIDHLMLQQNPLMQKSKPSEHH